MLIYNFTTPDNVQCQIQVELLTTPFVIDWKDYLVRTAKRLPSILWRFNAHGMSELSGGDPKPLLADLQKSFTFLQTHLDLDFSNELIKLHRLLLTPAELSQTELNTWHRHFTTVATEYYSGRMSIPDGVRQDEMFYAFHGINQSVHDLEFMTYPKLSRRVGLRTSPGKKMQYSVYCADARSLDGSNALWLDGHAETITESFDPVTEEFHYDVWLNEDIQGKDQIKAWLDEDDLSQTDVWGNSFLTPNVMFDPEFTYAAVLDNPNFIADYKASGKKLNRWPLGTVLNKDSIDWAVLDTCVLNSIELDGAIFWSN